MNKKTARKYYKFACEYFIGCKKLNKLFPDIINDKYELKSPLLNVKAYLLGHSLELGLKSFLIFKGITDESVLKSKFGHDLLICYDEAQKRGLNLFSSNEYKKITTRQTIATLSKTYRKKRLEYYKENSRHIIPLPSYFEDTVNYILKQVKDKLR